MAINQDNGQHYKPLFGTRKLADLVDFPRQHEIYPPLSEHEEELFADDVRANGLRERIDIVGPNAAGINPNTILDGHRRAAALARIGEAMAPIRILQDFKETDWPTLLISFIGINTNRRHLSTLGKARCFSTIYLGDKSLHDLPPNEEHELVSFLTGPLEMGLKNARRYVRLLRCPIELQQAVEAGEVGMAMAQQVALLSEEEHLEIAEAIQGGEKAKDVVLRCAGKATKAVRQKGKAIDGFVKLLQKANAEFQGLSIPKAAGRPTAGEPAVLHETRRLVDEILRAFETNEKKFMATVEKALAALPKKPKR